MTDTAHHPTDPAGRADEEGVRALLAEMGSAWNAGDADAYGACFTADATYIAFNGSLMNGRDAITEVHRWLFAGPLQGSRLGAGTTDRGGPVVRFVRPDVAHVVSNGGMSLRSGDGGDDHDHDHDDRPDPGHDSTVSLLAVRDADGRWRFTAFQNTRAAAA